MPCSCNIESKIWKRLWWETNKYFLMEEKFCVRIAGDMSSERVVIVVECTIQYWYCVVLAHLGLLWEITESVSKATVYYKSFDVLLF